MARPMEVFMIRLFFLWSLLALTGLGKCMPLTFFNLQSCKVESEVTLNAKLFDKTFLLPLGTEHDKDKIEYLVHVGFSYCNSNILR